MAARLKLQSGDLLLLQDGTSHLLLQYDAYYSGGFEASVAVDLDATVVVWAAGEFSAPVDVTHEVTRVFLRSGHLDAHDGFQQERVRLLHGSALLGLWRL